MVDEVPKITLPEYIGVSIDIAREFLADYFLDLLADYASAYRREILCATNEDVRKMNDHVMLIIEAATVTSLSHDCIYSENQVIFYEF